MEIYVPDVYKKSVLEVNYKKLNDSGVKCFLFDLDNTIAPFNKKDVNERIVDLFNMLNKKNMKLIIFSNSPKSRVEMFAKKLNIDYISSARKPFTKKLDDLLNKNKLKENEVAIIGDQLLTDIKVGNKVGILTVLVDPISSYDPIWTKISRRRENNIKRKLRDKGLFKGHYYDEKV